MARPPRRPQRNWSRRVGLESHALDLPPGLFARPDPEDIARTLLEAAQRSRCRKAAPFASAMAMLNFYINRAGSRLDPARAEVLRQAKRALRRLAGRV